MKLVDKPTLPKEMFNTTENPQLVAQAVRVYLANQRQGTQSALTRAEVAKTRKKYQKQKGSGNARHGDRKAPIFVGGGIAFAPKPRDHSLTLSDKMRKQAVASAFSSKNRAGEVVVFSDMAKLSGKTKDIAEFITTKKPLIVTDMYRENVYRAARNIQGVEVLPMNQVNVYEILRADKIIIMEEALEMKETKVVKEEKVEVKEAKTVQESKVKKEVTKKPVVKKAAAKKTK